MSITNDDVTKALGNMSVMQIIALTKELEQKWGLEAKPQVLHLNVQKQQEEVVEKLDFTVILTSVSAEKKMNVIKTVRELLVIGLKESKEFVEAAPKVVSEGVSKDEAERLRAKLEEAGAVCEVK